MKLSHEMIWITIAKAFHRPWSGRTIEEREYTSHGLCFAYSKVTNKLCPGTLFESMDTCYWPLLMPTRSWGISWKKECDLIRGDLATLFAVMTDKEFEELL